VLLSADNAPLVLHQILPGQSTGRLFRGSVPDASLAADLSCLVHSIKSNYFLLLRLLFLRLLRLFLRILLRPPTGAWGAAGAAGAAGAFIGLFTGLAFACAGATAGAAGFDPRAPIYLGSKVS